MQDAEEPETQVQVIQHFFPRPINIYTSHA